MSREARWLPVFDMLTSDGLGHGVARRRARLLCLAFGVDPDEVIDANDLFDFDDEEEVMPEHVAQVRKHPHLVGYEWRVVSTDADGVTSITCGRTLRKSTAERRARNLASARNAAAYPWTTVAKERQ